MAVITIMSRTALNLSSHFQETLRDMYAGRGNKNTFYRMRVPGGLSEPKAECRVTCTSPQPVEVPVFPPDWRDYGANNVGWLNRLKLSYVQWGQAGLLTQVFNDFMSASSNPYDIFLYLLMNCDCANNKKPHAVAEKILKEFANFISHLDEVQQKSFLTKEVKWKAFYAISEMRSKDMVKCVVKMYCLQDDREMFVVGIKKFIEEQKYKEACQNADLFKLHEHFSVKEFVIPLMFQDRHSIAEEFLEGSPKHQYETVRFLDSLLSKKNIKNEVDIVINQLGIPDVKYDKLFYKPLSKLTARLVKKFSLPAEVCPALIQKRNEGALQFILHKRYIDNGLSVESFKEMVYEAVANNPALQVELIRSLKSHKDEEEALYWVKRFNVPLEDVPVNIREAVKAESNKQFEQKEEEEEREESWDGEVYQLQLTMYHTFPLPLESIHLIDSESNFKYFIKSVQDFTTVGIDMEWKPNFKIEEIALALIQIAALDRVYILDVIALYNVSPQIWSDFCTEFLENSSIQKVGFSVSSDMAMIKRYLQTKGISAVQTSNFLDLCQLWRDLVKNHSFIFPYKGKDDSECGEGLAQLVELCLGKPINKQDQFSNWERRPLRESQMVYAALDAYCLLQVLDVITQCCEQQNIPLDEVCKKVLSRTKGLKKNTGKNKKSQLPKREILDSDIAPSPNPNPVPVNSLRLVCDTMVQGIGKYLRRLGADVVILNSDDPHDECVKIALRENRMIVTRGYIYFKLKDYVNPGHCFPVKSDDSDLETQVKEVLRYFNAHVTEADIFSRCQVCNGSDFMEVTQAEMHEMFDNCNKAQSQPLPDVGPDIEDSYCDDEFDVVTGFSSEEEEECEPVFVLPAPSKPKRNWNVYNGEKIDIANRTTRRGVPIKLDSLTPDVINSISSFDICDTCGKVYWFGSHYDRFLTKFSKLNT